MAHRPAKLAPANRPAGLRAQGANTTRKPSDKFEPAPPANTLRYHSWKWRVAPGTMAFGPPFKGGCV
jgi:hypothetical protein